MLNGEPVRHRFVLAYHKDRYLPKYMKDFIDITRDVFADLSDIRLDKKRTGHNGKLSPARKGVC